MAFSLPPVQSLSITQKAAQAQNTLTIRATDDKGVAKDVVLQGKTDFKLNNTDASRPVYEAVVGGVTLKLTPEEIDGANAAVLRINSNDKSETIALG